MGSEMLVFTYFYDYFAFFSLSFILAIRLWEALRDFFYFRRVFFSFLTECRYKNASRSSSSSSSSFGEFRSFYRNCGLV
jgi:hypothetical protein